jgi:hypothetical protein
MAGLLSALLAMPAVGASPGEGEAKGEAQGEADQLIGRGLELRRAGRSGEAVDLFRRAHDLAFTPRALGQLALAEASAQIWLDAETHLVTALELGTDAWVHRNRDMLSGALAIVRRHIGELVITGPATTAIAVDGRAVGTLPFLTPLHVREGSALVTATGVGSRPFSQTVVIQPGRRVTLAIVLEPERGRPVVVAAPALVPQTPTRTDRYIWAGSALIAAGAGLATWGSIWIVIDDGDAGAPSSCGAMCRRVYDTKTWGWTLAGGGAAAIAGGVALILGGRSDEPRVALTLTSSTVGLGGRF